MALYKLINKTNVFIFLYKSSLPRCFTHSEKTLTVEVDALDDFTTQLVQNKSDKWETLKMRRRMLKDIACKTEKSVIVDIDTKDMSIVQLNQLFGTALEEQNEKQVIGLMNNCLKHHKCPSLPVLFQVLSVLSQNGDRDTIMKIQQLCEKVNPNVMQANSDFQHYLAEATWIKGNINKALTIFEVVYKKNTYLRRHVRLMLKYLILDIVSNRSEAVLVNLIEFSEKLVREFSDFYPLSCVWQACFLSEWYTDQCLALQLIERNDGLCKNLVNKIPYVVTVALRSHQTEPVYRLLEILLKYEMKQQYSIVLAALFNYRFHQGDLQSCSEIIQWSISNNVTLSSVLHEKFLNLLLKYKIQVPKFETIRKDKTITKYQFKF